VDTELLSMRGPHPASSNSSSICWQFEPSSVVHRAAPESFLIESTQDRSNSDLPHPVSLPEISNTEIGAVQNSIIIHRGRRSCVTQHKTRHDIPVIQSTWFPSRFLGHVSPTSFVCKDRCHSVDASSAAHFHGFLGVTFAWAIQSKAQNVDATLPKLGERCTAEDWSGRRADYLPLRHHHMLKHGKCYLEAASSTRLKGFWSTTFSTQVMPADFVCAA
jgi:hypothetical protein